MKAVITAAGQGTRLYPQTHTKPKPMVRVAGKPILGHILDSVVTSEIDEVVVVVGVMKEMVIGYVDEEFGDVLDVSFVEQEQPEGLAHAVYQARPIVGDEQMCVLLGDMLFESEYDRFIGAHRDLGGVDGSIGVKTVPQPSKYGIVFLADGRVHRLEEKPENPDSNLAISGIYFIRSSEQLFEEIEYMLTHDVRGAGDEYQLTDALQRMLDDGAVFGTFSVEEWYDCGQPNTLLEANRVLLDSQETTASDSRRSSESSIVISPADIGDDVVLTESVVGPYVSIDDETEIVESHISNAIVGQDASLERVNLVQSLIGDGATVTGRPNELNIGDYSNVRL